MNSDGAAGFAVDTMLASSRIDVPAVDTCRCCFPHEAADDGFFASPSIPPIGERCIRFAETELEDG